MGIDEAKRTARRHFRQVRQGLGPKERARIDALVGAAVRALPEWGSADVVLSYLSFGAEVDTRGLVTAALGAGKLVALPVCEPGSRELRWFRVAGLDGLSRSPFGMEEPVPDPAHEQDPAASSAALALVPGLVFDEQGRRLGYGGGFYDRFLAGFPGTSVGLAREAQLAHDLRELALVDAHDRAVQVVVSERRTLRVGP